MANRFYTEQLLHPGLFIMTGDEAHHMNTVRRFQQGDFVVLFNGNGHEYPAEIVSVAKKQIELSILNELQVQRESACKVTIATALPKGDRFDFLLEKLVELGVHCLIPLSTERSIVVPKDDKREKWQRAVIEASKQCGRNQLMEIAPASAFTEFVKRDSGKEKYILHTADIQSVAVSFQPAASVVIAVGPEGGWSESEVTLAAENHWQIVQLGQRIMRIETACIAAAAYLTLR